MIKAYKLTLDPQDSDLKEYSWTLRNGKLWRKGQYLHHIVAHRTGIIGKQIQHIDQNPYNNQRGNLQATTKKSQPTHNIEIYRKGYLIGAAIVDIMDWELEKFKWHIADGRVVRYHTDILHGLKLDIKTPMSYMVANRMGIETEALSQIKFKNKNKFDNRRSNLKFIW